MRLPASAWTLVPLDEPSYLTVMIVAAAAWTGPECGSHHPHPSARIYSLATYLSSLELVRA